uniref:Kinesin motor domain-containing protein n=1 Tax=Macrostomum lignano TaxID=282301 RepID=A0A1I8H4Q8_9PLAT
DERSRRRSGAGRRHAGVTARPACRDVSLSFCAAPPERRSVGLDVCDFDDRTTAALVDAAVSTLDAADDLRRSYGLGAGELAQLVGELLRRDVKSAASQARPDTASTSAVTGSGLMVSRCVGGDNDDSSVARTKSAEAAVQCRPAAANKFAFTERLHNFEAATNTCRPQLRDQFTSPERSLLQHSVACGPAWPLTVTTDVAAIPDSPGTDSPPTPPTPPLEQSLPTLPEPAGRPAIHPQPGRPLPDTAGYARTQMPPGAGADSPIHQFSVAEAAAAAGALASPGSPRSILKRNRPDPAEQRPRDSKKGVRFQPDVVG